MTTPQTVLPGTPLPASPLTLGTHLSPTPHASLAGAFSTRLKPASTAAPLPRVSDIVLARVTRVTSRFATLDILALTSLSAPAEGIPFPYTHGAQLRAQDVRATEVDKVVMARSFAVGDVVRARVISLGDERSYYLSTAGDEMGVVIGISEEGREMIGDSWGEMVDSLGNREGRKVAKVV